MTQRAAGYPMISMPAAGITTQDAQVRDCKAHHNCKQVPSLRQNLTGLPTKCDLAEAPSRVTNPAQQYCHNGLQFLREPKLPNKKRHILYQLRSS